MSGVTLQRLPVSVSERRDDDDDVPTGEKYQVLHFYLLSLREEERVDLSTTPHTSYYVMTCVPI